MLMRSDTSSYLEVISNQNKQQHPNSKKAESHKNSHDQNYDEGGHGHHQHITD